MEERISSKRAASPFQKSMKPLAGMQALGRLEGRRMNKTELAYSQYLDALKTCGEILWYEFEAVKLRLADNTFFTVDFMVMRSNGALEAHETKGFMMDDANVKLKCANEKFPWPFFLVKRAKGGAWDVRKIGNK